MLVGCLKMLTEFQIYDLSTTLLFLWAEVTLESAIAIRNIFYPGAVICKVITTDKSREFSYVDERKLWKSKSE